MPVTSIARTVEDSDFERFDLMLAMDRGHRRDLRARCPEPLRDRIRLMREYDEPAGRELDVPDPYYSSEQAFVSVSRCSTAAAAGCSKSLKR